MIHHKGWLNQGQWQKVSVCYLKVPSYFVPDYWQVWAGAQIQKMQLIGFYGCQTPVLADVIRWIEMHNKIMTYHLCRKFVHYVSLNWTKCIHKPPWGTQINCSSPRDSIIGSKWVKHFYHSILRHVFRFVNLKTLLCCHCESSRVSDLKSFALSDLLFYFHLTLRNYGEVWGDVSNLYCYSIVTILVMIENASGCCMLYPDTNSQRHKHRTQTATSHAESKGFDLGIWLISMNNC